jgi:hypothetical protein
VSVNLLRLLLGMASLGRAVESPALRLLLGLVLRTARLGLD